jgi:hypothetical protein
LARAEENLTFVGGFEVVVDRLNSFASLLIAAAAIVGGVFAFLPISVAAWTLIVLGAIFLLKWIFRSKFDETDFASVITDPTRLALAQSAKNHHARVRNFYFWIVPPVFFTIVVVTGLVFNSPGWIASSVKETITSGKEMEHVDPFIQYKAQPAKEMITAPDAKEGTIAIVAPSPSKDLIMKERVVKAFNVSVILKIIAEKIVSNLADICIAIGFGSLLVAIYIVVSESAAIRNHIVVP